MLKVSLCIVLDLERTFCSFKALIELWLMHVVRSITILPPMVLLPMASIGMGFFLSCGWQPLRGKVCDGQMFSVTNQ